ncbi:D-2-hydroxyacid dehydrogenase [Brevundimonas sp.]|uniref:D-2-hydroxyacid dehydrogenase n=1 Tax=Brevundimonas sp. TaxID=1871086 RepID=UPI002D2FA5B1|nr:D-2-hydroxyacid dehydrogenase [Brevundimonas sp.]HYD28106.1 D-2-hydroxyacid dehydrogenase [Brevundimonas sp.]
MIHLLYVQKREILAIHSPQVENFVASRLPEVSLRFSDGTPHSDDARADWIIAPAAAWAEPLLNRASKASWIHFQGAGTDQLDSFIASRPDLRFTTSSGVNADTIAEYVTAALLHFAKDFDLLLAGQREGRWERRWLRELTGSTVVIFGTGRIGEATARRLRPFGVRLIGVSRSGRSIEPFDETWPAGRLHDVLPRADAVVIAAPLTDETAGAFGADQLGLLPDHCVIINVARGGILDETALRERLVDHRLRGAALDVFEEEPLPPSSALWRTPRLLITPHVAGTTQLYLDRMLEGFARSIPPEQIARPDLS